MEACLQLCDTGVADGGLQTFKERRGLSQSQVNAGKEAAWHFHVWGWGYSGGRVNTGEREEVPWERGLATGETEDLNVEATAGRGIAGRPERLGRVH